MTEVHPPLLRERPHKSAAPLYFTLAIAGAIGFAGLVAQVVAAFEYDPINLLGPEECPDNAWPGAATTISFFTLIPAAILLLAAAMQAPLIWAGGRSEWMARAVLAGVLALLAAAVAVGETLIWLEALASADCVEDPGVDSFM